LSVASSQQAERYYQRFSAEVGIRDWLRPNRRHEQIQAHLRAFVDLGAIRTSLDVGCGTGVMSAYLARFSRVTAIDFSRPAVELGRVLAPQVDFRVGGFAELPDDRYDLVCAFDVFEHIAPAERREFMAALASRVEDGGQLVLTTPHPALTRHLHAHEPELLQVIDEPVEVAEVVELAAEHGLRLSAYREYDVGYHPHYQMIVLRHGREAARRTAAPAGLDRAMRRQAHPLAVLRRRAPLAVNAARARRFRLALWLLRPRGAPPGLP
jgi:SAM-dependent methyltransferase